MYLNNSFNSFSFPLKQLKSEIHAILFLEWSPELWAPQFLYSHISGLGAASMRDGVGVKQMEVKAYLCLVGRQGIYFSAKCGNGEWVGGWKISWEFQFLCEVSYLEIFSLEQMKTTPWNWAELFYRPDLFSQLPIDYAKHLISQPRKQPWNPGRMLQTPIQCFYMMLNTQAKIPMVARQPSFISAFNKNPGPRHWRLLEAHGMWGPEAWACGSQTARLPCPGRICLAPAWWLTLDASLCLTLLPSLFHNVGYVDRVTRGIGMDQARLSMLKYCKSQKLGLESHLETGRNRANSSLVSMPASEHVTQWPLTGWSQAVSHVPRMQTASPCQWGTAVP